MINAAALQFRLTSPHTTSASPYVGIIAECDSVEQAREILATLPKALGLRAGIYYSRDDSGYERIVKGCLTGQVALVSNKANGGVNEAGLKRLARWKKDLGLVIPD